MKHQETTNRNKVEAQTQWYWRINSQWNGRLPWDNTPTVGAFMHTVKMALSSASTWRLAECFGKLLQEVVILGNKQSGIPLFDKPAATIHEPKFGQHIPEEIAQAQFMAYAEAIGEPGIIPQQQQ